MKKIILLDYGYEKVDQLDQYIETQGFETETVEHGTTAAVLVADKSVVGIVLAGGPNTIYANDTQVVDSRLFTLGIPLLGLGRGMQVMIDCLGGTVTPAGYQYAPTDSALTIHNVETGIYLDFETEIIKPLGFDAKVSRIPTGFQVLASGQEVSSGDNRPFGAIENPEKKLYGIQYVVDVNASDMDKKVISNFLRLV